MTVSSIEARRIFVLGGARSGKSSFAEQIAAGSVAVDYLATADRYPDDPEWVARVEAHRRRRPAHWRTIETLEVVAELARPSEALLMVDCLTVWLTRQMDLAGVWQGEEGCDEALKAATDALVAAWAAAKRPVVGVSNEVGQGVVPATASGRRFRDEMGLLNAQIAAASDEVQFCVAGLNWRLK